jgi:hypothetical protein
MLTAVNTANTEILAFAAVVLSSDLRICMCNGDGKRCSMYQIAQLIALFALDEVEQVLPMQFMPTRPGLAVMLENGKIIHSRSRTLAPWAQREINRLARALLIQHADYVKKVRDVLSWKRIAGFDPLPEGFVFTDPLKSARLAPPAPRLAVDLNESPAQIGIPWHHIVATDYARDRNLAHLSRSQLACRLMDVMYNVHIVDEEDRVSLDPTDPASRYWLSRLKEVQLEMAARYGPYPAGWQKFLAGQEWPLSLLKAKWKFTGPLTLPSETERPYLVKYGEKQWLEKMMTAGLIRLFPATRYDDPSLNAAIRDDERIATLDVLPVELTGHLPRDVGAPADSIARRKVIKRIKTNYYVYCMSTELETRIAHDFGYDAAIVIHDPEAFLARMGRAVEARIGGSRQIVAEVQYFDPLNVSELEVDVLTWKHFRYAYQHETRFAWLPPRRADELPALDLELGSLSDICSIVLPTHSVMTEEL